MKLEKRMMTLLLKGLVIIGLFGNGLMAYADEPDNYGTWYEQIEALESLKKQLLLWLEQEQADANKYGFDASAHTDAWKKLEKPMATIRVALAKNSYLSDAASGNF